MKQEVRIILDPKLQVNLRGDFFEDIVRDVLEIHRYKITSRVNFTGMEIDLLAKHKDKREILYTECKAKDTLAASEIHTFANKVRFKKADLGYFFSTTEYQSQVAGLIEEMSENPDYKNLNFFGPDKIIEFLVDSKRINDLDYKHKTFQLRKKILALSYLGDFYVLILGNSVSPSGYSILDANKNQAVTREVIELIKNSIPEVEGLEYIDSSKHTQKKIIEKDINELIETVAEVQESEEWFDYKPASHKHFIGRKDLRYDIFEFFSNVIRRKTSRRIFYLDGKSGWGKSSMIVTIRGISKNKFYKNRYFVVAVDCRSALSNKFVSASFLKLVQLALKNNFIKKHLSSSEIQITSDFDILNSKSIKKLLEIISSHDQLLIVIFDQFEDIFRKENLFKPFYKFLSDVNNLQSNLIVGFSWKSEVIIPADHESYYLWQQTKEIVSTFSIPEFGPSEINGVISQLERSIGKKIELDLRRKLTESSQGFPWLIKKLCIHTYNQIKNKITQNELVEQELNIETLFKSDLEGLIPKEIEALIYIAKRSYEGDIFDAKDIDEKVESKYITSLIHKRLIIVSGTKFNIYWDIFRDYLITGKIPIIGESYLLRQTGTLCYELFRLFKDKKKLSFKEIKNIYPRKLNEKTIDNILRDLKTIGLIKKIDVHGNFFAVSEKDITVDDRGFRNYLKKKFKTYSPYIKLIKLNKSINLTDLVTILKDTFKGSKFSEKTWDIYARIFLSWLKFVDSDDANRFRNIKGKGRPNKITQQIKKYKQNQWPYNSPQQAVMTLEYIKHNKIETDSLNLNNIYRKKIYDLKILGILKGSPFSARTKYKITKPGELLLKLENKTTIENELARLAMRLPKIKRAVHVFKKNPNINSDDLYNLDMNLFKEYRTESSRHYKVKMIYRWVRFIYSRMETKA